jgi:hypothetical protein
MIGAPMSRLHKREKGAKKGTKKEVENWNVHSTVAFFSPFSLSFCFIQYHMLDLYFLDLHHVEIGKGKTPRRKTEAMQKREQKGSKKGY